jgi:hypothetical protein
LQTVRTPSFVVNGASKIDAYALSSFMRQARPGNHAQDTPARNIRHEKGGPIPRSSRPSSISGERAGPSGAGAQALAG